MLYAIFQSYALLTLNYLCACINGYTACKHTVAPESKKKTKPNYRKYSYVQHDANDAIDDLAIGMLQI